MPSEGILASLPKNRVKTTIAKKGCMIAHNPPSTVCLYFTLISNNKKIKQAAVAPYIFPVLSFCAPRLDDQFFLRCHISSFFCLHHHGNNIAHPVLGIPSQVPGDVPYTAYPFSIRSLARYAPSWPDIPQIRAFFMLIPRLCLLRYQEAPEAVL